VQRTLGLRLVSEPQASLFERRLLGVRWLVIVDGLDEIVDQADRTEVMQALAARCRPGGDYRIIVRIAGLAADAWDLSRSIGLWLAASGPEVAGEILTRLDRRGVMSLQVRALIGQSFAEYGCLEAADQLIVGLVDMPDLTTYELAAVMKAVALSRGRPGALEAASVMNSRHSSSMERIVVAEHLAAAGYLQVAHSLWLGVLTRRSAPLPWLAVAVDRLVSTGATDDATAAVDGHQDPTVAVRGALVRAAARANETRG